MPNRRLPPALSMLLRLNLVAKLTRLRAGFTTPRKCILSTIALVLAVIWLSNAAISILYREPYDREMLGRWIPIILLAYLVWHLVKTAWKRPEEPIEWTPPEREFVCDGPYSRREQMLYRLSVIGGATLLKATCASLLLLPDLRLPAIAFCAIFLGLAFVDLTRMMIDVLAAGVSERKYRWFRWTVTAAAVFSVMAGLVLAVTRVSIPADAETLSGSFGWLTRAATGFGLLLETPVGLAVQSPFVIFASCATATALSWETAWWMLLAVGMVAVTAEAAIRLDGWLHRLSIREARAAYDQLRDSAESEEFAVGDAELESVPHWRGVGPLAWRQLVGARAHLGGLMLALAAPAVLSCLPLTQPRSPIATFAYVSAALGFYSLLLLPSALKFDFRRDVDRLGLFKLLPVSPRSVVLGQLLTPVGIASAFQLAVLFFAAAVRPVPIGYLLGAVAFLVPLNLLIFAMENLIFLMYPYRLNQEGLEVFLRTTLTFTAKSLLFAAALGVLFLLSQVARDLSETAVLGRLLGGNHHLAFGLTMWLSVTTGAAALTWLLSQTYERHDPCLDRIA